MAVGFLYRSRNIDIYLTDDGTIAMINIWPHGITLNIPAEYLQEFLDDMAQASIYVKLRKEQK
jgi:hypothetical protein